MSTSISAYVPCYNNAPTVRRAVDGLLAQTGAVAEIIVVDDGSTDGSLATLAGLPRVRLVRHEQNLGRGAARARAMRETAHEYVLCCDATNVLEPGFAARALAWFDDASVAAVFGVFRRSSTATAADRWRERHLFKVDVPRTVQRHALFASSGAMVRRRAIDAAGGFAVALRHSEDAELGRRLLAQGRSVVCDPALGFVSISRNTVGQVLERYWRWYAGPEEMVTWRGYAANVGYSVRGMAAADLRAGDWRAAAISLVCPHYQYWASRPRSARR